MQPAERRETRGWATWLLLAAVVALAWLRTGDLRALLRDVAPTRGAVTSDAAFYATPLVLGDEFEILRFVETQLPPATAIAVEGSGAFEERRQRFWLALLPRHPIAESAGWRICPEPCADDGESVAARGRDFVLLRRGAAGRP